MSLGDSHCVSLRAVCPTPPEVIWPGAKVAEQAVLGVAEYSSVTS